MSRSFSDSKDVVAGRIFDECVCRRVEEKSEGEESTPCSRMRVLCRKECR